MKASFQSRSTDFSAQVAQTEKAPNPEKNI